MADVLHSTAAPDAAGSSTRRIAYVMLAVVAGSIVGARILHAPPAFSVNDLSRWATIRALVDNRTYAMTTGPMPSDGDTNSSAAATRIAGS